MKSNKFFSPKIATKEDCSARWSSGNPGEFFHCALCGHKFIEGDYFHPIYTNSTPECPGNPIVCKKCDTEDFIDKWKERWAEWRSEKFWWFRKS